MPSCILRRLQMSFRELGRKQQQVGRTSGLDGASEDL